MKKRPVSLYAVILAGGAGTRFWPLSRLEDPKQFLKFIGSKSLFQQTIDRIKPLVPPKNIFIVTGSTYRGIVRQQIADYKIPDANILCEPSGKNTAPAVAWAASKIHARNPSAVMTVLPSDHLILNARKFQHILKQALELAGQKHLVTVGIKPTRPETGYGYLKIAKVKSVPLRVEQFVEKPSLKKAQKFLSSGSYLWNAGIFVWEVSVVMEKIEQFLPEIYNGLKGAKANTFESVWRKLPSISIDYGILEKADNIVTVPAADMGWSDVGSWEALYQVSKKDKQRNVIQGDVINIDGEGNFILSSKRLVATIGLKDLIVIDTPDALLVCRKDLSQRVKEIVGILQNNKRSEY